MEHVTFQTSYIYDRAIVDTCSETKVEKWPTHCEPTILYKIKRDNCIIYWVKFFHFLQRYFYLVHSGSQESKELDGRSYFWI